MKLADIVGSTIYPNLEQLGIDSIEAFVDATETLREKMKLARALGLSVRRVDKWASMTRLVQIDGIGLEYMLLLTACNIYSMEELSDQNAEALVIQMRAVNRRKRVVRRVPATRYVEDWIARSQRLCMVAA